MRRNDNCTMARRIIALFATGLLLLLTFLPILYLLPQKPISSAQSQLYAISAMIHAPGDPKQRSVAVSSSTMAIGLRQEIATWLGQGESSQQILHTLRKQFGTAIDIASPSKYGEWLAFVIAFIVLLIVVGFLMWYFPKRFGPRVIFRVFSHDKKKEDL